MHSSKPPPNNLSHAYSLLQSQNPLGLKLLNQEISQILHHQDFNQQFEKIVVKMN